MWDILNKYTRCFSAVLSSTSQHINSLSKKMQLEPILQLAEVLCRQLGACPDLPDDLKSLVIRPPPTIFASIVDMETIVCSPEGSAIPSSNCAAPSGDTTEPEGSRGRGTHAVPSVDLLAQSDDDAILVEPGSPNRAVQSGNGASGITPNEDSLQSTNSCEHLVM